MVVFFRIVYKSFFFVYRRLCRRLVRHIRYIQIKILEEYISQAENAMAARRYKHAVRLWRRILKKYKDSPTRVYWKLSQTYMLLNDRKNASAVLDAAIIAHKKNLPIRLRHIEFNIEQRRYRRAFTYIQELSDLFGDQVSQSQWLRFSQLYRNIGRPDFAKLIIENRLEESPGDEHYLIELAEILTQQENYSDAIAQWRVVKANLLKDAPGLINGKTIRAELYADALSKLAHIDTYKKQVDAYISTREKQQERHPRIVFYTAISGAYDLLRLPSKLNPDFDYIIFTDQPIPNTGIFKVRPLPYFDEDNTRSARYVKTHPHTLLSEYDIAIWIDANIIMRKDVSHLIESFYSSKKPLGVIPHPLRDNVYDEAQACIELSKDDPVVIEKQMSIYRAAGFDGRELIESGFIMFNLNHAVLPKFLTTWWSQINDHSRRDQLAFGYALWVSGAKVHRLMKRPNSVRNSPDFLLVPHKTLDRVSPILVSRLSDGVIVPREPQQTPQVTQKAIQTDVVVCVHNALTYVRLCLESIQRHHENEGLIIVDDGSSEETASYLREFVANTPWARLIVNRKTLGYTKTVNKGMAASTADFLVLLNSDTIVTKNWIKKMSLALHSRPMIGIVGPLSSAASHQSIPKHQSRNGQTAVNELPNKITPEIMNKYCEKWSKDLTNPLVPLVHGFCMGISRQVIDAIGYFDQKHFPFGYGEENDYCFRASAAGFDLVIALDTFIYHSKSKSYSDERRISLMRSGAVKLRDLYGREKIERSIKSMQLNPSLVKMRTRAEDIR